MRLVSFELGIIPLVLSILFNWVFYYYYIQSYV